MPSLPKLSNFLLSQKMNPGCPFVTALLQGQMLIYKGEESDLLSSGSWRRSSSNIHIHKKPTSYIISFSSIYRLARALFLKIRGKTNGLRIADSNSRPSAQTLLKRWLQSGVRQQTLLQSPLELKQINLKEWQLSKTVSLPPHKNVRQIKKCNPWTLTHILFISGSLEDDRGTMNRHRKGRYSDGQKQSWNSVFPVLS